VSAAHHILLVEDDPNIGRLVSRLLSSRGHTVTLAVTMAEATERLEGGDFQLLILDINLPDGNGLDLCKAARNRGSEVPVVFLTARQEEEVAVRAFSLGAVDYVRKPFGREELLARIQRHLGSPEVPLSFGSLALSDDNREARANGKTIPLTPAEHSILRLLVKKGGDLVHRNTMAGAISSSEGASEATIASHLSHLRTKLKKAHVDDIELVSVYGAGYRIQKK